MSKGVLSSDGDQGINQTSGHPTPHNMAKTTMSNVMMQISLNAVTEAKDEPGWLSERVSVQ